MSGILGVVNLDGRGVPIDELLKASTAIRRRGPDDEGYILADVRRGRAVACKGPDTHPRVDLPAVASLRGETFDAVLGFRGLAATGELPAGHQPVSTDDGRRHMVFAGWFLNHTEVRAELEQAGRTFRTGSPAEVLLNAYVHWGAEAFNRVLGAFALAVLDLENRELLIARDHFSIQPLFYTFADGRLLFASEIKALLEFSGVPRVADSGLLFHYARFGVSNVEWRTFFKGIRQVPSATHVRLLLSPQAQPVETEYWRIDPRRQIDISFDAAADRLREMLFENLRLNLRDGVPTGVAISGGIDSSCVSAGMRAVLGPTAEIQSFSHIADGPTINEERWMDMMIAAIAARSHKFGIRPEELAADADDLICLQDEPFGSTSIYAQARVYRLAHETGMKAMLDGQGSDEMLAGYLQFLPIQLGSLVFRGRMIKAFRFWWNCSKLPYTSKIDMMMRFSEVLLPLWMQRPMRKLVGKDIAPAWLNARWFAERYVAVRPPRIRRSGHMLHEQLLAIMATGLPALMRTEGHNAMTWGLQHRLPFLTPALAEFIFSLPEEYVISPQGVTKAVLRKSFRGLVPDPILDRRDKIGFATPERHWLVGARSWVESVLNSPAAAAAPVLNMEAVRQDWHEIVDGNKPVDFRVWRWVNLIRWAERFSVRFDD